MSRPLKKAVDGTASVSSATSTLILAANSGRKFAVIGGSQTVGLWLAFGEAAVVGSGTYLPAGASYHIDEANLWVGIINGILASGANQSVGTTEMS